MGKNGSEEVGKSTGKSENGRKGEGGEENGIP